MEARLARVLFALLLAPALMGAGYGTSRAPDYQTRNFVVFAPTRDIAKQVGNAAEIYRKELAIEWLGYELPQWSAPCPIKVKVGQIGAGGATTFSFYPNAQGSAEVCNWDMNIQGSLERILDSVLPHEVSHTIFACHFRRPLPRWADEGAATLAEHESERRRQDMTLRQVFGTPRRIALKNLLSIKDYPSDPQDVLTLYAEGYSLADLLVQEGGRARYLKFVGDAHQNGWERAIRTHYGYRNVDDLEKRWHEWVIAGSPELKLPKGQMLADASRGRSGEQAPPIVRGQKPAETEDPFLEDSATEVAETPKVIPEKSPLAAPQPRQHPLKRKTAHPLPAPQSEGVGAVEESDDSWVVDEDAPRRPRQANPPATERPGATSPEKSQDQDKEVPVAEARNSAKHRQVTEWSEFPQDPRPSPFALPGRNRSGARP
jgi:hypothetical protein